MVIHLSLCYAVITICFILNIFLISAKKGYIIPHFSVKYGMHDPNLRPHLTEYLPSPVFHEEGYILIEIKQSSFISGSDAKHLKTGYIFDRPVIHSFVLSNDHRIINIDEKITAIPVGWFLGNWIEGIKPVFVLYFFWIKFYWHI